MGAHVRFYPFRGRGTHRDLHFRLRCRRYGEVHATTGNFRLYGYHHPGPHQCYVYGCSTRNRFYHGTKQRTHLRYFCSPRFNSADAPVYQGPGSTFFFQQELGRFWSWGLLRVRVRTVFIMVGVSTYKGSRQFVGILCSTLDQGGHFFTTRLDHFFRHYVRGFTTRPMFSMLERGNGSTSLMDFTAILNGRSYHTHNGAIFVGRGIGQVFVSVIGFVLGFLLFGGRFLPCFNHLFKRTIVGFCTIRAVATPVLTLVFSLFGVVLCVTYVFVAFMMGLWVVRVGLCWEEWGSRGIRGDFNNSSYHYYFYGHVYNLLWRQRRVVRNWDGQCYSFQ